MERLTEWIPEEHKAIPRIDLRSNGYEKCATRLAEYEDLGLTLEEIKDLLVVISECSEEVDEDGICIGYIRGLIRLAMYEKLGTLEQVQELKERDTAKKPIIIGVNGAIGCRVGECPKCGGILRSYMRICDECGQRLDFGGLDEI